VEVAWPEVKARMNEAAGRLGQSMRVPGFRAGKVPPAMVIQRYGHEAVLDEAVRSSVGGWYMQAIDDAEIRPVGDPELTLGDMPEEGSPLTFSLEIGVRPVATLGKLEKIDVARREPEADAEVIDAQLEQMRQQFGRLEAVDRAAQNGDYVVIDFVGYTTGDGEREAFEGGEGRDHLLELGGGRFIPGFEEQLIGASAGDQKTVQVTFPESYPAAPHLEAKAAEFDVTVHEVKAKELPELDDDFASEAGGFDTLAELRADLEETAKKQDAESADKEYEEAVLDAVVELSEVDVPESLAAARAKELWEQMLHQLSHRGLTKDAYLQMAGQDEDALLAEATPDAAKSLRREAVLAAFIESEGIEPSDGDLLDAVQGPASQQGIKPEKLLKRLEKNGRLDELKEDLAQRRAVELLVERASS
jgi:trigger factor